MSAGKADVVRSLRAKGLDPVRLERELVSMLRSGSGAYEVRSYLKRLLEGGGR
jgi:invasion protein IalB